VKEYRFVSDYPAKIGVKSSQSGKPSHCPARARLPTHQRAGHSAHFGRVHPVRVQHRL
jgi:hypothetical protein